MSRWDRICLWGYKQWLFDYIVILNFSKFIDQYLTISSVMFQPCSNYKPLATKLTSKHPIIRWSWWNQTEDQTGPIQIHHLWGRHWTHSFSWKPSSSSVLNFFPQPRHTFVCERKSWEFVSSSRLRCWFNLFQWAKTLWVRACRARPSSFSQFWERKTESCKPQKCRSFFKTFQNLYLEEKLWWDKPDHIENIQDRSDRVGSGHGSPDVEYAVVLFSRFSNEARI